MNEAFDKAVFQKDSFQTKADPGSPSNPSGGEISVGLGIGIN